MTCCRRDIIRTARKRHVCIWCGELIEKNESYTRSTGINDDGPYSCAYHQECVHAEEVVYTLDIYYNDFYPGDYLRGHIHSFGEEDNVKDCPGCKK